MKLPFPFSKNKAEQASDYYLALLLTDEKARAVLLHETDGKVTIIGKHQEFFSQSIEAIPFEELINLVDKTISHTEEILPPNIETHKTVFGVKETWIEPETKKIKKEYLVKLKKVCDALDLTPIGFMVVNEAISHLLQEEEGAPVSAILAEVGQQQITLTLLRGGKKVEQISGPIEEQAATTADTLLRHFTTAVLPARIILFDGKTNEELSQQFISHQWSKSLPFLHVPQITVLPAGFDGKAVASGAAIQMGFELVGTKEEEKEIKEPEETKEQPQDNEKESVKEDTHKTSDEEMPISNGDNFGFVTDQDIATIQPEPEQKPRHHAAPLHHEQHHQPVEHHKEHEMHHQQTSVLHEDLHKEEPKAYHTKGSTFLSKISMPKISFSLGNKFGNKKVIILPLIILALLLAVSGGTLYYYLYQIQTHVLLSIQPKMVEEKSDVILSTTGSSDFSKKTLAAQVIEATVDGELTSDATGKKEVGEKAKGSVTIYNNGDDPTTLSSGTALKSSNGTTFLLDKDVKIASASGDIFSGTKPGTVQASVTAKELGTESNLPSGTKFAIGSNTTLAAKNDSAFSGGTKKQVTVVSKNDIEKLKTDLLKTLETKAQDAMKQKASGDDTVLPIVISATLQKPKFDKGVDDEAKTIKLAATAAFEGVAYHNATLTDFAKSILKKKYSDDISFSDKTITTTINDPTVNKDKTISATMAIQAGLLPNINTDDVVKQIAGKSLSETKAIVSALPQVTESTIQFSPSIPLLPEILPWLPKNVSVEVRTE